MKIFKLKNPLKKLKNPLKKFKGFFNIYNMILKYFNFINENLQLADKYIFNKNILSNDDKEYLLRICSDKKYFFILSQFYIYIKNYSFLRKDINLLYQNLKDYDKKFIDIKLDLYKNYNKDLIGKLIEELENVNKIKEIFNELPSIALRNLKHELKTLDNSWDIKHYLDSLKYLQSLYSYLGNKDILYKKKIEQKIFKNNTTLRQIINFVDEKHNLFLDEKISKKEIIDIIEESQERWDVLNIVYEKNDILVVEVSDPDGIKKIGKYSLWCFTYGKNINYYEWNEYSYNGIVYVIFDFSCLLSDPYFSMVLIKPFKMNNPDRGEFSLWDNHNEPIESNPKTFLSKIIGTTKEINKIFTFKPIMDEFY